MSSVVISGDTSGSVTLQAPAVSGSTTINLPTVSGGSFIVSNSSGNVGIGTASPASLLAVDNGTITTQRYGSTGAVVLRSASGTQASPTVISSSTGIGQVVARGYDGSAYQNVGVITFISDGAISSTSSPGYIQFATTPSGSVSSTERMRIDSSGYITNQANGNSSGLVQGSQYYRLNTASVGANATGAQSVFGVGVSLAASTQYEFEAIYGFAKTAGATSHTFSLLFGGTATLNNIGYELIFETGTNALGNNTTSSSVFLSASTAFSLATIASATSHVSAFVKGTISVNAAGTFIPQYSLSAAPGGAYSTAIGSYFKISPLAASGSNISIGSWA